MSMVYSCALVNIVSPSPETVDQCSCHIEEEDSSLKG